jgi:two-component system, NtrC family, response regulator AtoC
MMMKPTNDPTNLTNLTTNPATHQEYLITSHLGECVSDDDSKTAQGRWDPTQQGGQQKQGATLQRALLVLDEGGNAQVFPLPANPKDGLVTIGRGGKADIRIDHPSLSRLHARLNVGGSHITLEDLDSSNGTFTAGIRLKPNNPVLVAPNAHIELADVVVILHVSGGRNNKPSILSTSTGGKGGADALDRLVARVAQSHLAVLVVGEQGVGKNTLARKIHEQSGHANDPFIVVKGSDLTNDADRARILDEIKRFPQKRGTVVIDEIVLDTPYDVQRKVLADLSSLPSSIRLLSTSACSDLGKAIEERRLLRELYHLVNGITVVVPPLRARISEIATLTQEIAAARAEALGRNTPLFSPDAIQLFERHPWPGNVRELGLVIDRAMALQSGRVITASHIEGLGLVAGDSQSRQKKGAAAYGVSAALDGAEGGGQKRGALRVAREDAEYQRIVEALRNTRGNQTQAAKLLGISRGTLVARLERYNMPRPRK